MKLSPAIAILLATLGCNKKTEQPVATTTTTPDAVKPPATDAPGVVAAPTPDAAAVAAPTDDNPRTSELCSRVLVKIFECQKDKHFLEALDEGVEPKRRAADKKHLAQIVKWHYTDCGALPTAIEEGGFLDHWSTVVDVPSALDSCGKLGTTLNSAGGLFGGDIAN
jgi:hypothetical protein